MADVAAPAPAGAHAAEHGHHTSLGISSEKLAMWAFLGSECMLFGALISTYLLYRTPADINDVAPYKIFDIPFTSVSSFVLLMSSLTMVLAVASMTRGDVARSRQWILATALLGGVFLAGQIYEFTAFVNEGMGYTLNRSSSAFYTLTGFHGAHVTVGILILMSLFLMSRQGRLSPERAEVIEIAGLYWHFVDIVWIIIFTVVYLIPV